MLLEVGDIALDYSYARPSPAAMRAAGVRLVVRYISPRRSHPKNLDAAERDALLEAGLGVLLVWENATTDPLRGRPLGAVHGFTAGAYAAALGYPRELPIIAAVDFGVSEAQLAAVIEYLAAFGEVSGYPTGVYGSALAVDAATDAGVSVLGWQTRAWSHGRRSAHADCLQHIGLVHPGLEALGAIDDNEVLRPFAAWSTTATYPVGAGAVLAPVRVSERWVRRAGTGEVWEVVHDAGRTWAFHVGGPADPGAENEALDGLFYDPGALIELPGALLDRLAAKGPPVVVVIGGAGPRGFTVTSRVEET